jgi:hypothetical protein
MSNRGTIESSPDEILDLALEIKNYLDLQHSLLKVSQACFCQHTYSSLSRLRVTQDLQVISNISEGELIHCLEELSGRLKFREEKYSYFVTPSRFWKKMDRKVDALIVGASTNLSQSLRNNKRYLVVEVESSKVSINGSVFSEQEPEIISVKPSVIYQSADSKSPIGELDEKLIHAQAISEEAKQYLHFLAEDHLLGEYPISFISIPLSYYVSGSSEDRDFLALEMVWIGSKGSPHAIDFPKEIIDSFVNLCLRVSDDIVHELVDIYHSYDYGLILRSLRLKSHLVKTLDLVLQGGTTEKLLAIMCNEWNLSFSTARGYLHEIADSLKQYVKCESGSENYFVKDELQKLYPINCQLNGQDAKKSKPKKEEINAERLHFILKELFPPKKVVLPE